MPLMMRKSTSAMMRNSKTRLDEGAVAPEHVLALRVVADRHGEIREIDVADDEAQRRHDDITDEGGHDLAEGAADHDTDREVDDVAFHREFFEF